MHCVDRDPDTVFTKKTSAIALNAEEPGCAHVGFKSVNVKDAAEADIVVMGSIKHTARFVTDPVYVSMQRTRGGVECVQRKDAKTAAYGWSGRRIWQDRDASAVIATKSQTDGVFTMKSMRRMLSFKDYQIGSMTWILRCSQLVRTRLLLNAETRKNPTPSSNTIHLALPSSSKSTKTLISATTPPANMKKSSTIVSPYLQPTISIR